MRLKKLLFSGCVLALTVVACNEVAIPKPKAMLRLDYPVPAYSDFDESCPFDFEKNNLAQVRNFSDCSFNLEYLSMDASIFVTYKPVEDNLDKLLRDAQKLTYEHVVKADGIVEQPFLNGDDKVYGMYYELQGNAASQAQFYLTDSINHFITGALYFNTKPNYDSVMPAASYLENDIRKLMETFKWKK